MSSIRCSILRGGTSKGVFLFEEDLPPKGFARDKIIKRIMGTPDARQIDGLGGADILTSKVAIIGKSSVPEADVDYTFAQVGIDQDTVSYEGNCGNISAAVGPFAIENGIVHVTANGVARVKIYNTNIKKLIIAEIPMKDGKPLSQGDYTVDGVPGTGAKIMLDFADSAGSVNGKILPTGLAKEILDVPGVGKIEASIVDLANPVVFIHAGSIGLKGTESPQELDSNKSLIEKMELIRGAAAVKLGFVDDPTKAFAQTAYVPFFCFVSKPQDSQIYGSNKTLKASEIDLQARLVGIKKTHKTFPGTGAVCLAAAAKIPGTIVNELTVNHTGTVLKIGHPSGIVDVEIKIAQDGTPQRVAFGRTWRKIMEGQVYI